MELLQLKYFQKVAYLEHMTRSAEELHIAQPSLSKTIHLLERELGIMLFDRNGKFIKLNDNGRAFLKNVDIALAALEKGKQELVNRSKDKVENIYLAVLAASPLLPGLLSQFRDEFPEVNFHLLQHLPKYLNYDFDLCISCLPLHVEGITSIALITENIMLAVPVQHPLATRTSVQLQEVAGENFILLRQGSALREIIDSYCKLAGFTPRIAFESDDPGTLRGLIKAGQGVSFFPAVSWGDIASSSMVLLPIEEPECKRTIGLSWAKDRIHSEIVQCFSKMAIDYFKSAPYSGNKV